MDQIIILDLFRISDLIFWVISLMTGKMVSGLSGAMEKVNEFESIIFSEFVDICTL